MSPDHEPASLRIAERALLGALLAWLAASVALVSAEPYDGLDAILVARYFTGAADTYVMNRGPLMGLLLAPVDLLVRGLALPAFELRPYHAVSAALHGAYLVVCLRLVYRIAGRDWAAFLAFAGCVPTFVFFSYAPFISHDLVAGAMLLAMIALAGEPPGWRRDAALAALGAAAALLKYVFALFTIAVVITALGAALADRRRRRDAVRIAAVAAAAGAITWLTIAVAVGPTAAATDGTPLLLAPLAQLELLRAQPGTGPWWLYPRHAFAYGTLAVVLLVPGAWLTARGGSGAARTVLAAGALLAAVLLALPNREVRYLAILSPLAAVVVAPAVRRLLAHAPGRVLVTACLLWGVLPGVPYSVIDEAARIARPFYRAHPARAFLAPIEASAPPRVFMLAHLLSFAPRGLAPLAADRFHRWFHVGADHVHVLLGLAPGTTLRLRPGDARPVVEWVPGAAVIVASAEPLSNPRSWAGGLPARAAGYRHEIGLGREVPAVAERLASGEVALDAALVPAIEALRWSHAAEPDGAIVPLRLDADPPRAIAVGASGTRGLVLRGYEVVSESPAVVP